LPASETEAEQHRILHQKKRAEAYVGSFLSEKLPEFVFEVTKEHLRSP